MRVRVAPAHSPRGTGGGVWLELALPEWPGIVESTRLQATVHVADVRVVLLVDVAVTGADSGRHISDSALLRLPTVRGRHTVNQYRITVNKPSHANK